jgi:hypothetical protein
MLIAPTVIGADGTLEALRDDVRTGSPDDSPAPPDHHDHHYNYDDDDSGTLAELYLWIAASPFWGPHVLLGDNMNATSEFLSYPYKRDWNGNLIIEETPLPYTKWWHLRARGEYADDFDRMTRAGGHVLFDTTFRLGLDTSFDYRQEDLSPNATDDLWTGDMNLLYRFAQSERVQMRAGLGANWLADEEGSEWGFNFTYGGDLMPIEPFVLSAEIDWGRLGHAELFHGRTTVGVEYHHVELYTGFDYYDVGQTQISGWITGVRLWF